MLRIGPLALEYWHLALAAVALVAAAWIVRGFMVRIQGTWRRVDDDSNEEEVVAFAQFGPFVRGRRVVPGGFQEYTGVLRGRTMFMTRRDHGRAMLERLGFPPVVASEIEGSVTARLRLTLSADGRALFGTFVPQRIEFQRQPPKVTRRVYLEPQFRRYRLESRALDLPSPPSQPGRGKPYRRTV